MGIYRNAGWVVGVVASLVAALTITAAPAQAAGQQIYEGERIGAIMECKIRTVVATGAFADSTWPNPITNDGYQDRAWFEFMHYNSATRTWVHDSYSTEMRNNDHLVAGQASWYDYPTGISTPRYPHSYSQGTWVAVKVWILSGRDNNWHWTWAISQPVYFNQQTAECQVYDNFCPTDYACYPSTQPPGTTVVGGIRIPGT